MPYRPVRTIRLHDDELKLLKKAAKKAGHKHWSGYMRTVTVAHAARLVAPEADE